MLSIQGLWDLFGELGLGLEFGQILTMVMKYVRAPLAQAVLIPLGLTVAASAVSTGIHENILGSGTYGSGTTTLIMPNKEIEDVMKC